MAEINDAPRCLNCGERLLGSFCSNCGQETLDLHRPLRVLVSDVVGDILNLDTRLLRTLRPLLLRPGVLTREYLAGRRACHVPPLKTYLIAALIFFGVLALLPKGKVAVVTASEPFQAGTTQPRKGGSKVIFRLPEHYRIFDRQLQAANARAKAHPQEFSSAVFDNLPRVFFLLLPAFALFLELFYRSRYYLEHLIFALHYHAFVFLDLTLLLLLGRPWVPSLVARPLTVLLVVALLVYLPLALRKVYGGSWPKTLVKLAGLGILYFATFTAGIVLVVFATLSMF
jgi:hypothetical protein